MQAQSWPWEADCVCFVESSTGPIKHKDTYTPPNMLWCNHLPWWFTVNAGSSLKRSVQCCYSPRWTLYSKGLPWLPLRLRLNTPNLLFTSAKHWLRCCINTSSLDWRRCNILILLTKMKNLHSIYRVSVMCYHFLSCAILIILILILSFKKSL